LEMVLVMDAQSRAGSDPFWRQAAKELASQAIRLVRLSHGREATTADLRGLAANSALFDRWLERAKTRVASGRDDLEGYRALEFWKQQKWDRLDSKMRASVAAGLKDVRLLRASRLPRAPKDRARSGGRRTQGRARRPGSKPGSKRARFGKGCVSRRNRG